MYIFLVILMYATWSSVFSLGKMALQYSPPFFLTGFRMGIAGLILLIYLSIAKRASFATIDKKQWFSFIALSFFSIYLTNVCEFWGLQHLSAAKTCFLYSLSPFFAALFSYLHFKEKMSLRKWIGLCIGVGGMLPVLMIQTGSEELMNAFSFLSWPALAVILGVLASVYGWVLLRLIVKNQTVSPLMANGISMLIGGSFALFHSFFFENWTPLPITSENAPAFLKITLFMVLLFNLICYNLYGMMLKRYTATFLSVMGLLSPVFASLMSWFILGEQPSWIIFLSTAIVSLGLWVVYKAELAQGYILNKDKAQDPV